MKIPVYKSLQCIQSITVDNQDYIFAAVLKAGPVVSKLSTEVFAQVYNMADVRGCSLVFTMNLLDQSKLVDQQESFSEQGLAGWWKLVRNDKEVPRILLQEAVDITNADEFRNFVLHANSAGFVKQIQSELLDSKQIWKKAQKAFYRGQPDEKLANKFWPSLGHSMDPLSFLWVS